MTRVSMLGGRVGAVCEWGKLWPGHLSRGALSVVPQCVCVCMCVCGGSLPVGVLSSLISQDTAQKTQLRWHLFQEAPPPAPQYHIPA